MAVYGLKPAFKDLAGYKQWRKVWAETYTVLTSKIRKNKMKLIELQRTLGTQDASTRKAQQILRGERAMAFKLNSLLDEAKIRMQNITKMRKEIQDHVAQFPLEMECCKNVDFHFNKKHLEHDFVPMWIVKAKGQSFYVQHVESRATWTTRETPDHPATKGAIRFKSCNVSISADGVATIY
jgi:DNA-binding TFAR19-related protein (PDSD5 family)